METGSVAAESATDSALEERYAGAASSLDVEKTARSLGWSDLLATVAGHALNARTADQLRRLLPLGDRASAEREHTRVREALRLAHASTPLPLRATPDLASVLARLQRGSSANAEELHHCALVAEHAQRLYNHVREHSERCPLLVTEFFWAPPLGALAKRLNAAIDERGQLLDAASPGLLTARRALVRQREQLREEQQRLLAKHRNALAGAYFAERGGRFVLPVRTDAGNAVEGIVLGSSSSGSTLYVEPHELTAKNNALYVCEARVQEEEEKVLLELSQHAQGAVTELEAALQSCDAADKIGAVARWATLAEAEPIHFAERAHLVLYQMRHPLLLQVAGAPVVANDLRLKAGEALIISGPNAGGKTVALKCLGLAAWMARAGLPIPCDPSSEIGWFDAVLCDIGDDQSLSRSLSTFSAHVTHLARYLKPTDERRLVLLDEVAGGTDPDEGAALAVAVLERLVKDGAAVATTTHYERLKQLGASDVQRFANASVGFDLNTMRPTFHVALGVPGASSALAVAARFGIPTEVVARAEELMPREHLTQQRLLDQIEQERDQLRRDRVAAEAQLKQELTDAEKRAHEHTRALEKERAELRTQAATLNRELLSARSLLEQAKTQLRSQGLTRQALESVERLISDAAAPITLGGTVTQALYAHAPASSPLPDLEPGVRVFIPHLNSEAEVLARPDKQQVRVSVSGLKMTVPLAQLRPAKSAVKPAPGKQSQAKPGSAKQGHKSKPKVRLSLEESSYVPVRTSANVCDLRGVRVEQGLEQVDTFLDKMLRLQERAVFVLHGHGTGAMRQAVREHLTGSRFVERWTPAEADDGGDALTVVWLG